MRYLLLTFLVFAVAIPAFADEVELKPDGIERVCGDLTLLSEFMPVFSGKAEQELLNDSGTPGGWAVTTKAYNTITVPYDCLMVAIKFYAYCPGSSGSVESDVIEDDGTGTTIYPETSLIGGPVSWSNDGITGWKRVDLPTPIFVANGTVVHPGQHQGVENVCQTCVDNIAGEGGLWVDGGGSWQDYSSILNGKIMTRIIVDDDTAIESASLGTIKAEFK